MKNIEVFEDWRVYVLSCGTEITIKDVELIQISDSGSHRVTDKNKVVWYIPDTYKYFKFKGEVVA